MSPEEREEFAATVARLVAESNVATEAEVTDDAKKDALQVGAEKPAE